jgi:heat-inducible transcriptional repressor
MTNELSNREKVILSYIIEDFIRTAIPVGSRHISKNSNINLSPATIRNVMSDLEDLSYITHPHTSGGRIPTDKGYRFFVEKLMNIEPLSNSEKLKIKSHIEDFEVTNEEIYKEISKILGKLTKEISIVSQPIFSEGILEKIEIFSLSSSKILVVVSIGSGLVRTLMFDLETELNRDTLDKITQLLNEKLSGLSLKKIRNTFKERISDLDKHESGVIKIFVDSIDKIFQDEKEGLTLFLGGTVEVLSQPEFGNTDSYKNLIELTGDRDIVFHVLNNLPEDEKGVAISIGNENTDDKLKDFSIVSSSYSVGSVKGKIAIIGPKRMNYSKIISFLNYTSKIIQEKY